MGFHLGGKEGKEGGREGGWLTWVLEVDWWEGCVMYFVMGDGVVRCREQGVVSAEVGVYR